MKRLLEHVNRAAAAESIVENRRVRVSTPREIEKRAMQDLRTKLEKLDGIAVASKMGKRWTDFDVLDADAFTDLLEQHLPGASLEIV
jgi:hypothetical protein